MQCVSEEAVEPGQGLESNPDDTSTSLPPDWVIASPPDYFLGEAIVAIRCAMDPILEDPEPPIVFPHDVLRLSICGQSETARKALSAQLKEDYGIEILIVENLVTEASKIGKDLSSDIEMSAYESLCQKAYKLVACGESISDQVYVDLIFAKLQELVDSEAFKGLYWKTFHALVARVNCCFWLYQALTTASKSIRLIVLYISATHAWQAVMTS